MGDQAVLERILNGDEEPKDLPLGLLQRITNDFSGERKIGQGAFGEVYKGVYNGEELAVKRFNDLPAPENKQFENECVNLLRIRHPNIVRLLGYCYVTQHKHVEHNGELRFSQYISRILCFEYLQGGSLDKYLNEQSLDHDWPTRYNIIEGICEGLNFLHGGCGSQILHLDLKPANILLDKYMGAKVADFGLSRFFSMTHTHITDTTIGTWDYMPPEFRFKNQISPKNDVYSLGIIIIEIMAGRVGYSKFREMDDVKPFAEQVTTNWREWINATTSPFPSAELDQVETCINIAIKCVNPERENRPTVAEILDTLQETERKFLEEWRNHAGFPVGQSLPTPTKSGPRGGSGGTARDIKEDPWRLHSLTISYQGLIDSFSFSYIDQSGKKQRVGPWGKECSYHKIETIRFSPSEFVEEVSGAYGSHGEHILVMSLTFVTNIRTYGPFGNSHHQNVAATPFKFMADEGSSIVGFHGRSGSHLFSIGVYMSLATPTKSGPRGGSGVKVVDEVNLMVVYEPTKPQENCKNREGTNMPAEEVPKAKRRKIVESASGKGKLGSSEKAEAASMDINSSARGHRTKQTERCNLYPLQSFSRRCPTNMKYLGKESDRVVDVTRGAMGSLLNKLGKLVTEDYNLEKSMKRDIESFSEELTKIHLDLPKLQKLDGVKIWVNKVREMSYNIEDMVDSFLVHVEPNSSRSGFRELTHEGLKRLENDTMTHREIGDVIRDIKNQVQAVANRQKKYNFDVNNVVATATAKAPIDPRMDINKEQLIGIEARTDQLIRLFEEDGNVSKQELRIVSIVGLGGLGKTTLAKAVYDKLKAQYHSKAFVPVGQNPDVKKVLMNILIAVGNNFNASNLEVWQLKDKLEDFLQDKRYFIVIDDIWDLEAWGHLTSAFPRNNHGSRVITTTRIERVARACCEHERKYVYKMEPLSEEDSRRLFLRRIFGRGKDCPNTPRKEEISKYILKKCGGMPLAINSIASLLDDEPESTWEYIWKSLGSVTERDGLEKMKQILDLSYIHLPDYLKTCLLYVCMYPEDREIDKTDLSRKWVAEGFVHVNANSGLDAEDVAGSYFKQLISMCMIEPAKRDYYNNEVLSCRVHDIILDLMRSKSTEVNFTHVMDGSKYVTRACGQIRRVSVQYDEKKDTRIWETINKRSLSHVRSVFLYRDSPVPCFLEFKYVRVLHIERCSSFIDFTCISRMFLLRYLKIALAYGYGLKQPNQIGGLQQLETLHLNVCYLENYPSDIASLPCLSHLRYGGRARRGIALPDGIDRLKSLRSLEGVSLSESSVENILGLGKLTNLRKLHIFPNGISIWDDAATMSIYQRKLNNLHSSICMLSASLRILNFENLPGLPVDVSAGWSRTLFPQGSHILELDLRGCIFRRCPEWIGQLHYLYKFRIWVKEVADGVSIVEGLPSLASFKLYVAVWDEEEKEESVVIPGSGAFKALKKLNFRCPKASLTFEEGAMPKLEKLRIEFRNKMTRRFLPVGIHHLPAPTLKQICLSIQESDDDEDSQEWDTDELEAYYRSDEYKEESRIYQDKTRRRKRRLRTMLKRAFKQHHPGANLRLYGYIYDKEDDDNEDYGGVDDEEDYEEDDDEEDDDDEDDEENDDEEDDDEEDDDDVDDEEDDDEEDDDDADDEEDDNEEEDDGKGVDDEDLVQHCRPVDLEDPVDAARLAALEAELSFHRWIDTS